MSTEKSWENLFSSLNNEWRWLRSASKLKHSADILFANYLDSCRLPPEEQAETEDGDVDGVATMLYGLAMENILKAVLLKEGVSKTDPVGKIKWNVEGADTHDLLAMCRSLNVIKLNAENEKLMERMSAFVHWAGKYPTPWAFRDTNKTTKKEFKGLLLSNQPQAAKIMLPVEFRAEDKIMFEEIYEVLSRRITD